MWLLAWAEVLSGLWNSSVRTSNIQYLLSDKALWLANDDRNVFLLSSLRFSWPDTCCSAGEPPVQEEVRVCKSANPHFIHGSFIMFYCLSDSSVICSVSVQHPHTVTVLSCATHFSHDSLCFDSCPVLIVITLCQNNNSSLVFFGEMALTLSWLTATEPPLKSL